MFIQIITVATLIMFCALVWHNQPARDQEQARSDDPK
jgi:hypothetical protein